MRIDSHHHIWDLSVRPQDWLVGEAVQPVNRTFTLDDYRAAIAGTGVEKSILVQTVMKYEETPEFLEIAADNEIVAGVVGWLEIGAEDALTHLDHYETLRGHEYLVSIREVAHDIPDPNFLMQPQVIKNIRDVGKRGYVYDLLTRTAHMPAAIELVRQAPETQFVIDHISKPLIADGIMEPWREMIKVLAAFPNTVCKISGMTVEAKWDSWKTDDFRPYVDVLLEAFGPSRLMFGSDWPVSLLASSYHEVISLTEELTNSLSPSESEEFWSGTATRVYKLDTIQKSGAK
jgi:L-fuconolactonase